MAINHTWNLFCVMAVAIETNQNYGNSNEMVTAQVCLGTKKNHILAHKKKIKIQKTLKELTLKGKAKTMEYEKI